MAIKQFELATSFAIPRGKGQDRMSKFKAQIKDMTKEELHKQMKVVRSEADLAKRNDLQAYGLFLDWAAKEVNRRLKELKG